MDIEWSTKQPKRLEFGIYTSGTDTKTIVEDEGRTKVVVDSASKELRKILKGDELSQEAAKNTANWSVNDTVKAGMYKFAAVFYNEEDEGEGKVIGYYIDILYVDGGNLSEATVKYGDKFQTKPENPTWLAVETVFIPQKGASTINANDWYYAKFHWDDNSTNETGFELVITEEGKEDDPYIVNPTELATSPLKSDKLLDNTTAATTANNHLDAGSTSIVLKLQTEKKYTAKIRAINDLTPPNYNDPAAEFCENLNRNGDGKGRDYAPIVGDDKRFGMFSVNYNLNDGKVTKAKNSTTDENVKNYVVGFNYHSEQQDLMTDNILSYPFVSKVGYVFDHWNDATKRLDVIPAENTDNLALTAVWGGSDIRVSVTFPSYADANVKIAADRNSDNTVLFKYSTTNNSISVTAGASLDTPEFELTKVGNNGKPITTGASTSGSKWTWTPTNPTPGFYCLQITGTYEDLRTGRTLKLCGNVYIEVQN